MTDRCNMTSRLPVTSPMCAVAQARSRPLWMSALLALCVGSGCTVDREGLSALTTLSTISDASADTGIIKGGGGTGGRALRTAPPAADAGTDFAAGGAAGGIGGQSERGSGGAVGSAAGAGGIVGPSGIVLGTGGSPGTAGIVGSGGVGSGTGGGGATTGAGGFPGLAVEYTCRDPQLREAISFKLRLVNKTALPIPLTAVKVRYWFTLASPTNLLLSCDYAAIQFPRGNCADIVATSTFKTVTPPRSGANAYIEVGFDATAGSLDPFRNDENDQMLLRISDPSNLPIDQSDDYSYDCSRPDTEIESPRVTAYISGSLAFGREPPP